MHLHRFVNDLVMSLNEQTMMSFGGQYTALRVLTRIVGIGSAMRFVPSSAQADSMPVRVLANLADNGVFRPEADGQTRTEEVDRLLGQLHARRAASMAPGEPTAITASTGNRNNLALLSSVLLSGSGDGPFEAWYDPAAVNARRGRMHRFLSVARNAQAGSTERPSVTLPAALVDGRLPALGFGRECGGKASLQTTYWSGNPFHDILPGGQAFGAVFRAPVVAVHVASCDERAPRELAGLAPEEELVIAFPSTRVAKELASGQLESRCLRWDGAGRTWSTDGCRVVASTLGAALARASAADGFDVEITCSCNQTGAFAATVNAVPNGEAATAFSDRSSYHPIVDDGSPDVAAGGDEDAAPLPRAAQAAALFLVFLPVGHAVAFLVALILYSRWGQAQLLGKHAALLLQSQGAKRLLASLVDAEAAKKRRWSIAAAATATSTDGGSTRPQTFDNPIAEKMRAYDPSGGGGGSSNSVMARRPPQQQQGQEEDEGAKARRALYEAEQLYDAAQGRQRLFHNMEKGSSAQRFLVEVAEQEMGAFLTSACLRQQQGSAEDEQVGEQPHGATAQQQTSHPAATLHMTVRPLAPGSAAANASAAAAGQGAAAATHGAMGTAAAIGARPAPAAMVQASLQASRQRQIDLQQTILFVVKHLVLLLVCAGRFEAPTAQLGGMVLRDCADAGMGDLLRAGSVCVQPQQFIFRNLIQFAVLLPLLLFLYALLPGAFPSCCRTHTHIHIHIYI